MINDDPDSGIQRSWNKKQSIEIGESLEEEEVVLPNTIIVNFRLNEFKNEFKIDTELKFKDGLLYIPDLPGVAYIIDGQHRLRAFDFVEIPNFKT